MENKIHTLFCLFEHYDPKSVLFQKSIKIYRI